MATGRKISARPKSKCVGRLTRNTMTASRNPESAKACYSRAGHYSFPGASQEIGFLAGVIVMSGDDSSGRTDQLHSVTRLVNNDGNHGRAHEIAIRHCHERASDAEDSRAIAIVENRVFLRECICRSLRYAFAIPIDTYSSVSDLDDRRSNTPINLIIFSMMDGNSQTCASALNKLSELRPEIPVIILSYKDDFELAHTALSHGAKGYIPVTMGFEIAIEAVRFVLAGGTFVPAECVFARDASTAPLSQRSPAPGFVTARELAVVRAIRQGKPNKIIAYELNMCESTVKVHVRNIMKKLRAKNRTDVAIKSADLLSCSGCTNQVECWSLGHCSKRCAPQAIEPKNRSWPI
jgi:DNA-binding NarL/FixJ family response regulator